MNLSCKTRLFSGTLVAAFMLAGVSQIHAGYVEDRDAAVKLYWADKTPEAMAVFIKLAEESELDLQKAEALDWASRAAIRLRDYDKAMELATNIPLESMSLTARARVLARQSQWQAILDLFEGQDLGVWRRSTAGEAYLHRAVAYERLEKSVDAISDYNLAADMADEHNARANALLGLGRSYLAADQKDLAVTAWERVLTESQNTARHTDAVIAVSRVLNSQEKYQDALDVLAKVDINKVTVQSLQVELLIAKAITLTHKSDKDQAKKVYNDALDHKGITASRKLQIEKALKALES